MTHPLDRPAWHALHTRQAQLAVGQGGAMRYLPDYAIFAVAEDDGEAALAELGALIRATGPAILLQAGDAPLPPGIVAQKERRAVQMVAESLVPGTEIAFETLGDQDAVEMLALATLTEPGPFFARTNQLGAFIGVRDQGRLIAMAGERMKLSGYTEVSGVCTHPDFRGRGLAGALMRTVARRIVEQGDTPFLHAYADNAGAIGLYESLGFRVRSAMAVKVAAA